MGILLLAAAGLAIGAAPVSALPVQVGPGGDTTYAAVWEVEQEARWLHGGRNERFVRPTDVRDVLYLTEPPRAVAGRLEIAGSLRFPPPHGRSVVGMVGPGGAEGTFVVEPRPIDDRWTWTREDSLRARRSSYFSSAILNLPEMLFRELAAPATSGRGVGASWSDAVDWSAERTDARQGERRRVHRTLLGDTLVDGRRVLVVRDSAWVEYRERWAEHSTTLGGDAIVERGVSGPVVGVRLVDAARGVTLALSDSAALRGEAVRILPDGRRAVTPARFLRTRQARLHDREGWIARTEERRRSAVRRGGGLRLPATPIEERLAQGDRDLVDSLVAVWDTAGGTQRYDLGWLLRSWGSRSAPGLEERMDSLRRAAGDTVPDPVEWICPLRGRRLDLPTLERFAPYLPTPAPLWVLDVKPDHVWSGLRQVLMSLEPGTLPCTPAACARLEEMAREAPREPRLHDLVVLARMMGDPAAWADSVEARVAAGSVFLRPAADLARGVAATWPAGAGAPLPPRGAGWRDWAHWMDGRRPDYPGTPPDAVRFHDAHRAAVRFVELRAGRDVSAEIRTAYEGATADSARLVFGGMLLGMDEHVFSPDSIVALLRSGSDAARRLGELAVGRVISGDGYADVPVGIEETALADSVVAQVAAGAPLWPHPSADPALANMLRPPEGLPLFVAGDHLSEDARARWREAGVLMSDDQWAALPEREGRARVRVSEVRRRGPFVLLSFDFSARSTVAPDEPPQGWASGLNLVLARVDGRWEILSQGYWIT